MGFAAADMYLGPLRLGVAVRTGFLLAALGLARLAAFYAPKPFPGGQGTVRCGTAERDSGHRATLHAA